MAEHRIFEGRAGDQIVQQGDGTRPTIFRRKVTRRVEEPVKRQVRVPVRVKTVVPHEYIKRVPVIKHIEVTDYEDVEEVYTEMVEETRTRDKELWLPQTIQEPYQDMEMVQVPETVRKPVKRIVPREEIVTVMVKGTKVIKDKAFRIDEIKEIKKVEIEEWEHFKLVAPQSTGIHTSEDTQYRELEVVSSSMVTGSRVYTREELDSVDLDATETVYTTEYSSPQQYSSPNQEYKHQTYNTEYNSGPTFTSGFDLDQCLDYTNKKLAKKLRGRSGEFCNNLKAEYKYFDRMLSGSFSPEQLKQGLWFRDRNNKGVPIPQGPLQGKLQEEVDGVLSACRNPDVITFWDFAQYLLTRLHGPKLTISYPNKPWAGPGF